MKKRSFVAVCMALCLILGAFSGCGDKPEQSKASDKSNSQDSGEVIKIRLKNFEVDGQNGHIPMLEAIDRFNEDHKGEYEIINEQMPADDPYTTSIAALASANDLPDICMLKGGQSFTYGEQGMVKDMTDLIKEYGIDQKMKPDVFGEHTSADGRIFASPLQVAYYGYIFYNEDIFKEAGIEEFPKTMDELIEASKKIKAKGYIPMALGVKDPVHADSITFSALVNNYVGNDWFDSILANDGKAKFTDQEFINALADYQKVAENEVFNENFASIDINERLQLYMSGKAAMISSGAWENQIIHDTSPEVEAVTAVAAWPAPAEGAKATNSVEQSCAWGFALGSKIADEAIPGAMDFIANYQASQEWGQYMAEERSEFVAWECDYDESLFIPSTKKLNNFAKTATMCRNWDTSLSPAIKEVYQRGLQELLVGMVTPEELAQEIQEEYELSF